jgi:predicted nucleic-acid-binding Zn-ribbon protein
LLQPEVCDVNLNAFRCAKCDHDVCEVAEMRATGGMLSKLFDIQNRKFSTVTCARCKYTEFYAVDSSMLGNVFDFFVER